jgi:hypothetical protein
MDPLKSLDKFGKVDENLYNIYDLVCKWRVDDTVAYMKRRFKETYDKQTNVSIFSKFGNLIRWAFIVGVVLLLVGPHIL